MILWCDVESTGLDPYKDLLLEVAAVITDDNLVEVGSFSAVVDAARRVDMNAVDPYVQQMHAKNGLWNESLLTGERQSDIDAKLVAFIKTHCDNVLPSPGGAKNGPQLGGSTVNFDRAFLQTKLPKSHEHLHYRNLDVSSLNELARRCWTAVHEARPQGGDSAHRALSDIRNSIATARYYAKALGPIALPATLVI